MYNYDPRTMFGFGYAPHLNNGYAPAHAPNYAGNFPAHTAPPFATTHAFGFNGGTHHAEMMYLLQRVEELKGQVAAMYEMLRASNHSYGPTQNYGAWNNHRPVTGFTNEIIRVRENDSHIYCDLFLPQLTIGDVEVEVSGNRIICRTRIPVGPLGRWFLPSTQLPRGFELFELPDGRIECSWFCPVAFNPKEVEASFRDGFLSILIPKMDTNNGVKHPIKVSKETNRRSANEMNS